MPALNELKNEVLSLTPRAPNFLVERELLRAAQTLFSDTHFWTVTNDTLLIRRVAEYELEPPADTQVLRLDWLVVDGDELKPRSERQLLIDSSNDSYAKPLNYAVFNSGQLRVHPTPDKNYSAQYQIAVTPVSLEANVDDYTFNKSRYGVVAGAVAGVAMTPGPWQDPGMGQYYKAQYEQVRFDLLRSTYQDRTKTIHVTQYGGI